MGTQSKIKRLWLKIFERCYDNQFHKDHPSYVDCSVSESFHNFQFFEDWCKRQVGFGSEGFQLDKDILVKDNKIYSENTCCFVPKEINMFYTKANKIRGKYPIGVSFCRIKKKFISGVSICGKHQNLGYFDNEWSAFLAYKKAKENRAKELAEKWRGQIDDRAYERLINYKVLLTD